MPLSNAPVFGEPTTGKIGTFPSTIQLSGKLLKSFVNDCTPKSSPSSSFFSSFFFRPFHLVDARQEETSTRSAWFSPSREIIITTTIIILHFQLRKCTNMETAKHSLPDGRKYSPNVYPNASPLNRAERIILQIAASKARSLLYDRKMTNALPRTEIKIRYCRY